MEQGHDVRRGEAPARPVLKDGRHNLPRIVFEDLRTPGLGGTIFEDFRDLYSFYLDDDQRARLAAMGRVKRAVVVCWWIARSLFLRLSPARRLMLVGALFLSFQRTALTWGKSRVEFNPWPWVALILLAVLALELKDKLLARDEIEVARRVQLSLMPLRHPSVPGWSVWSSTAPANSVGGDVVDYLPLADGRVGVALGDVAGKGMGAALLAAKLQATLRALAPLSPALAALGERLNASLHRDGLDNRFATLFYAEIDGGSRHVRWLNAGHLPALLLRADRAERLAASGPPLGIVEEVAYREEAFEAAAGDVLVVFSDGLTEARSPQGDEFGEARLLAAAGGARTLPPEAMGAAILTEVARFAGPGRPHDDRSIAILRAERGVLAEV